MYVIIDGDIGWPTHPLFLYLSSTRKTNASAHQCHFPHSQSTTNSHPHHHSHQHAAGDPPSGSVQSESRSP
ncbi:unnamed protein product [Periconia digitata]|uniref:Uncharacterized protein n=1 Tax=Periconia digitata TaxID=1303443 RepID=A0A9W4U563_9PLEO|nr:unnamed protein product [Periconia digitata]